MTKLNKILSAPTAENISFLHTLPKPSLIHVYSGAVRLPCWENSLPQQGNVKSPAWVQDQSKMCDRVTDKGRKMLPAFLVGDYLSTQVAGQTQGWTGLLLCMQSWRATVPWHYAQP